MRQVPAHHLKDFIGQELGCSNWLLIDQARIDRFADATGDHQYIHVDPVRAANSPFGTTVAHGLLTLSLIPSLLDGLLVLPEGLQMTVNYGLDAVRFIQPVPVNAQVRLRATLLGADEKRPGQWLLKVQATLEVEGQAKPACVAEALLLCFV